MGCGGIMLMIAAFPTFSALDKTLCRFSKSYIPPVFDWLLSPSLASNQDS
jgi:hypothetical protein